MIDSILLVSLLLLVFSVIAVIYRVVKGPSNSERVQALDAMTINLIAGVAILSVWLRSTAFFEIILLLGILSFIATIALARYIERGVIIERKHSD